MVKNSFAIRACLVFLIAAVPVGCSRGTSDGGGRGGGAPAAADGLEVQPFTFQGMSRPFHLHVPAQMRGRADNPLVVVLHGGMGSGVEVARQTDLVAYADRYGFIAAFPKATESQWNDGRTTTATSVDDVAYVGALIDHLTRSYGVNPRRVFATGLSNGGMFTLRLACDTNRFAAVASVVANLPVSYVSRCRPQSAKPILMMNGTEDRLMKWNGGEIPTTMGIGKGGEVVSTPQTVALWVAANGCRNSPRDEALPDRADDGTRVIRHTYADCSSGKEVVLYEVRGGGHAWPGSSVKKGLLASRVTGNVSQDINASEVILEFFRRYGL
jgi:polyhydroxybutyrate depolymerase